MADYNPSIPQGSDNLSTSQGQILNNFTQLNNIFAFDHYTWNDATTANRGLHRKITFPSPPPIIPTPSGTESAVYSNLVSAAQQLFFKNAVGTYQLTNPTISSSGSNNGMQTPFGVKINWGLVSAGGGTGTVTFALPFTTLGSVVLTPLNPSPLSSAITGESASGFTAKLSQGASAFYFAIGT